MGFETWIAFVAASAALLAIPGPTVTVVVGHAIGSGRRASWGTVPGVVLGDFTAMTASLLGAGAILATSATLFTAMKLIGALYLIWLGIKLWRARGELDQTRQDAPAQSTVSIFWNCYVVTALNPKDILFFVAFVPQFINPSAPILTQVVILEATFLIMVGLNITLWSVSAGHVRTAFARPGRMKALNRFGGTCLIGAGLLTTTAERA